MSQNLNKNFNVANYPSSFSVVMKLTSVAFNHDKEDL
jgi:hypothetical protein